MYRLSEELHQLTGQRALERTADGKQMNCPFIQPLAIQIPPRLQGQPGSMQVSPFPCGEHCPHFNITIGSGMKDGIQKKGIQFNCASQPNLKDIEI